MEKKTSEVKLDKNVKTAFNKVKKDLDSIRTAVKIGYGIGILAVILSIVAILA